MLSFIFKRFNLLSRLALAAAERMTIFAYLYVPSRLSACWWWSLETCGEIRFMKSNLTRRTFSAGSDGIADPVAARPARSGSKPGIYPMSLLSCSMRCAR